MSKIVIPPHLVLKETKEVIFYSNPKVSSEIEITGYMKYFPSDYKGMVIKSACLFKRLREDIEK
tara:strand:+ start:182 stop:373 length:192 start_codon:yes stop_codon:yes gene_type:complete